MSYQLLLTNAGATKIATASNAGGTPLHITDFAVGQGVNVDFSTRLDKQTLVAKRYQGKVESVNLVAPNKYEIVCVVPVDVGGFTIREFGLIADSLCDATKRRSNFVKSFFESRLNYLFPSGD